MFNVAVTMMVIVVAPCICGVNLSPWVALHLRGGKLSLSRVDMVIRVRNQV